MFKNKLNIIALGLVLGIVATPALTFAAHLPYSPEDGFNCPVEYPKERDLTPAEIKANFVCLDRKTTALFSWIDAIVRILEQQKTISSPVLPGPQQTYPVAPPQPIKEIPIDVQVLIPPQSTAVSPTKPAFGGGASSLPTAAAPIPTVTQVGWNGPEVKVIQDFLKAEGSFTYPQATGYFGPITRDAVKTFQTKYKLPSTGVVDKLTLEKMQSASSQVAPAQRSPINDLKPTSQ